MGERHLVVVGSGSVGKRHAQNLTLLGCRVACVDPREDRRQEVESDEGIRLSGTFATMADAIEAGGVDGVVVASPPSFHVAQCVEALGKGLPVLLEKPVSPDEAGAKELAAAVEASGVPLLLGYTYRWWPPLVRVRELLGENAVGKLRYVRFVMSAHLADWHPWERYQDFFMASRELGGGALLDESHWLDLMLWFFGWPTRVSARIEKLSDLDIDTDDNVDLLVEYPDSLRVGVHLDIYGRPHEKYVRFVGEEGTLLWTFDPNRIAVSRTAEEQWEETVFDCERNEMFLDVDREYLSVLDGGPVSTCTIEDGVRVLSLIEAARRSQADLRWVDL